MRSISAAIFATIGFALVAPSMAQADGIALFSSGGGVYEYELTVSAGSQQSFPTGATIVLSGLSGVTAVALSKPLSVTPAACGLSIGPHNSTSVTLVNNGPTCVFAPANSGSPGQFGTLELLSTDTNVGTVNFAISGTDNPTSGTTEGPVAAAPVFAGIPGTSNCHGQSIAGLAQQYGGISAAAQALGYAGVADLQGAVRNFCGG